jgi:hypothetical protein
MPRLVLFSLLVASVIGAAAPSAQAVPAPKLDADLAAVWSTVLSTPDAQNPFGSGGVAFACIDIGGTVSAFGPNGVPACTVKPGTKIFVIAFSTECSTFEGQGPTEAELRACAEQADLRTAPSLTIDGQPRVPTKADTGLLRIALPADNLFGLPPGAGGVSVADGWVLLLHPLTPGTHTIVIDLGPAFALITTSIMVQPNP